MAARFEYQPQPIAKEIPLEKWFKPFQGYSQIPDHPFSRDNNNRGKEVWFTTKGLGRWQVGVNRENDALIGEEKFGSSPNFLPAIIANLNGEIVTSLDKVAEEQDKLETPLVGIDLFLPDRLDDYDSGDIEKNPPPFTVQIQLPSGTILDKDFSRLTHWSKDDKTYEELYVPETPFIMEQLEMMIVRN